MNSDLVLSFIVPVYEEQSEIDPCLEHISRIERSDTCEVIVVDGHDGTTIDSIGTRQFPFELRCIVVPPGRGAQLHQGALRARSQRLVFLHVDTRLPKSAVGQIERTLRNYPAGAFDFGVETRSFGVRLIAIVSSLRNRLSRLPYGDQTHFFLRDFYHETGGYLPIPIMEDVELMKRLRRKSVSISILHSKAMNSDRRWRKEGVVRSTLRNWYILLRYRFGASPYKLTALYRPHSE